MNHFVGAWPRSIRPSSGANDLAQLTQHGWWFTLTPHYVFIPRKSPRRENSHAIPKKISGNSEEIHTPFRESSHTIPKKFSRRSEIISTPFRENFNAIPRKFPEISRAVEIKVTCSSREFFQKFLVRSGLGFHFHSEKFPGGRG